MQNLEVLIHTLCERFDGPAFAQMTGLEPASSVALKLTIDVQDARAGLIVRAGCLLPAAASERAHFTIFTRDLPTAAALFEGRADPMQAFLNGDFRSSGYIMWTFALLRAVQPA
ncbi:MAG: hypothetical protein AAF529_06005 [Pseudomonadota bacterium]